MPRMVPILLALAALGLSACGEDGPAGDAPAAWQHATVQNLAGASGLTLVGDDLVFVVGGDDRDVRSVARSALRPGATATARTLAVTIRPDAPIHGADPLAAARYGLEHLWKVPVDFQAVAFQPPDMLYVGERHRRLVFWGRIRRDAAGVLAGVKFSHVAVVPGADRSKRDAGDWRDQGPGLSGLVAVKRSARQEDLWAVDAGAAEAPITVRRMDRFGSNLQGIRARHGFDVAPDVRAVSHDGTRLLVLMGKARGRIVSLKEPPPNKLDSVPAITGVPGPAIDGVDGWTGMAHAEDGTIFLVSGGSPAVVAWRTP